MNHIIRKASGARLSLFGFVVVVALAAASVLVYGRQTPNHAAASQGNQVSGALSPNSPAGQNASAGDPNVPMTKAQGDEILSELHALRLLIQNGAPARIAGRVPPPSQDVSVPMSPGWHSLGRSDAPVTMIEFTDLQCPFCRQFEKTTFADLMKQYVDTGKVRVVSVDLPLAMHPYALGAAEAEQCAAQQGKFWEFRNAVLDDQEAPTPDVLLSHASQLALHVDEFQKCVENKSGDADVQAGVTAATALDIHGTPGFVVGRAESGAVHGVLFTGARPLAFFEQSIDGALNQSVATANEPDHKAGSRSEETASGLSGSSGSR